MSAQMSGEYGTPSSQPILDPSHELPANASPDSTGTDAPKKKSWTRTIVIGLIILAFFAFIFWRIHENKVTQEQEAEAATRAANRPIPISVQPAKQQPMPIYLTALGTVTAYNTVTVKSRVDGQITAIDFTEGQHVRQGQTLVQIDPKPYQAALAQAKGNLARDQANAELAHTQSQRYTALYQAGVVSRETAQTEESSSGQAVGTIAGDKAAIEAAQVNLAYTRISAPITGIVGLRQVDIGNVIAANSTTGLVVLTQVQPIAVIFTLPEDQLPQVFDQMRKGGKLGVEAWDRANTTKIATGSLLTVDNQIDTTTGTAKLKAVFANADEHLYPNQFVNVRLILETRQNALVIPASAVQNGTNGTFVYLMDKSQPQQVQMGAGGGGGGRHGGGGSTHHASSSQNTPPQKPQTAYPVHAQPVKIFLTEGAQVILGSGLKPGDMVVVDGQEKLKDGSLGVPRQETAPSNTALQNQGEGETPNTDNQSSGQSNGSTGAGSNSSGR